MTPKILFFTDPKLTSAIGLIRKYFPIEKDQHSIKQKDLFIYDLTKKNFWHFYYKQTTTGAFLKKIGDLIEHEVRYLRDKYKLSKYKTPTFQINPTKARQKQELVRDI